jgi:xylan 1,4-beta-xylosidase
MNTEAFQYYNRLERVRCFVEANVSEEISLGKAGDLACMERTSFSRFFGNKVGIPFSRWLKTIRVARAQELLEQDDLSIIEITHAAGFSSLRTFQRVFKQFTDRTPSQFKKAHLTQ